MTPSPSDQPSGATADTLDWDCDEKAKQPFITPIFYSSNPYGMPTIRETWDIILSR